MNEKTLEAHPLTHLVHASALFLREAVRNRHDVGAVAPSGTMLARALTQRLEESPCARRVLEVGGGTGSVTYELMRKLGSEDRLDIVESNPRFADVLDTRIRRTNDGGGPRTQVHRARMERFETSARYDLIVSGLPFANFEPHTVRTITSRYRELLADGGTITYFAYRGTRRGRAVNPARKGFRQQREVEMVLAEFRDGFDSYHHTIWANVPPARVWVLQDRGTDRCSR